MSVALVLEGDNPSQSKNIFKIYKIRCWRSINLRDESEFELIDLFIHVRILFYNKY